MKKSGNLFLILLLLFAFIGNDYVLNSQVLPSVGAELIPILQALQSIKQAVSESINQANQATHDRLVQLENILDGLIGKVEQIIQKGYEAVNMTREQLFKNIFDTIAQTNKLVQDYSYTLFIRINQTISNFAGVVDSLPIVKVDPYIFAVDPYRIKKDRQDRKVFFYGYFGNILWVNNRKPKVFINDTFSINLERYDGGRLGFTIPDEIQLNEGSFINLKVLLFKRSLLVLNKKYTFNSRVYIEKSRPMSFIIEQRIPNPSLWENISGTISEVANSNVNEGPRTISASTFFSRTINDNIKYDMDTAMFSTVDMVITGQGRCCGCAPNPSASVTSWNPKSLDLNLSAPFHSGHMVYPGGLQLPYWCGGGGSNIEVNVNANMRVKKRNTPEEILNNSKTLQMALSSVHSINVGSDWSSITITGIFEDRDERYESIVYLTPGISSGSKPFWSASVNSGQLSITTLQY